MYQIMLPHGGKRELAKDFGVSEKMVWEALAGRKDTNLAKQLRKAAIERGGQEFDPARKFKSE